LNIKGEAGLSAIDKVNRIMNYIVELGLFESSDNVITCLKLAQRIDNSIVKNPQLKQIQQAIRENKTIPDNQGLSRKSTARLDKTRLEENRIDKISNKDEPNGSEPDYILRCGNLDCVYHDNDAYAVYMNGSGKERALKPVLELEAEQQPSQEKKPPKKKKTAIPNDGLAKLRDFYHREFFKKTQVKAEYKFGRDDKIFNGYLKKHDMETMEKIVVAYMSDDFGKKCGYTVPVLQNVFQKLLIDVKKNNTGGGYGFKS